MDSIEKGEKMSKIKTLGQKKGQSTVEYILLAAAVIGALVVFLGPNGVFSNTFGNTIEGATGQMTTMVNRLNSSR